MKIAILGGRFDPIHVGHLIIAQDIYETFEMDRILFLPSYNPPHKPTVASYEHRYNMVKLAIEGTPYMDVSMLERELALEKSYTYLVVKELMKRHPENEYFLIVGSDQFMVIDTWYRYRELLELISIIVVNRSRAKGNYPKDYLDNVILHEGRIVEVSSSEIRKRIEEGKEFRFLVPESVYRYILKHKLYMGSKVGK